MSTNHPLFSASRARNFVADDYLLSGLYFTKSLHAVVLQVPVGSIFTYSTRYHEAQIKTLNCSDLRQKKTERDTVAKSKGHSMDGPAFFAPLSNRKAIPWTDQTFLHSCQIERPFLGRTSLFNTVAKSKRTSIFSISALRDGRFRWLRPFLVLQYS